MGSTEWKGKNEMRMFGKSCSCFEHMKNWILFMMLSEYSIWFIFLVFFFFFWYEEGILVAECCVFFGWFYEFLMKRIFFKIVWVFSWWLLKYLWMENVCSNLNQSWFSTKNFKFFGLLRIIEIFQIFLDTKSTNQGEHYRIGNFFW